MSDFKEQWNLDMALEVLRNPTVDAQLWSESVKWLLLYGPHDIKEMLLQSSGHATSRNFPELKPSGFTEEGDPCYDVQQLAEALGITEDEAREKISRLQEQGGLSLLFDPEETKKIQ
ncbi:hypothetical protein ACFL6N_02440 [Thermodesulfobacteriota bacterium]